MDYKNCYVIVYTMDGKVLTHQVHEQASVFGLIQVKVERGLTDGPVPCVVTATAYDANGSATELLRLTIENKFPESW